MGDKMQVGEGERIHAAKRRRYWKTLSVAGAGGVPVGFLVGYFSVHSGGDVTAFWREAPDAVVIAIVAAAVVAFIAGCLAFVRSIDEVDLLDNLWGSTAAYYAYAIAFPAWWARAAGDIVPPVNGGVLWFAALVGGLLYYGWRKWDAR
jgi:hypothetical protein